MIITVVCDVLGEENNGTTIAAMNLVRSLKKKGHNVNSDSLVASGSDAFNDAILSISVLASAIVYILFTVSIEAYVGVLLSLFIIKAGLELIKESVDNMLGVRVESNLAKAIKRDKAI